MTAILRSHFDTIFLGAALLALFFFTCNGIKEPQYEFAIIAPPSEEFLQADSLMRVSKQRQDSINRAFDSTIKVLNRCRNYEIKIPPSECAKTFKVSPHFGEIHQKK